MLLKEQQLQSEPVVLCCSAALLLLLVALSMVLEAAGAQLMQTLSRPELICT